MYGPNMFKLSKYLKRSEGCIDICIVVTCYQRSYVESFMHPTFVRGKSMHARICICMVACMQHTLACARNSSMRTHANDGRHEYAIPIYDRGRHEILTGIFGG